MTISHDKNVIRTYLRDGFVVINDFFPQSDLDRMQVEVDVLSGNDPARLGPEDVVFENDDKTVRGLERMQNHSSYFADLTRDRRLVDLAEAIFGASAVCLNVSYLAKAAKVGSEVPFHQDNAYYNFVPDDAVTVWIALDDVTEENGCMRVIPGLHREGFG